jgi:hypothetical protein
MNPATMHTVVEVVGAVIAGASFLANWVAPWTIVGKALHFIALNGPALQEGARAVEQATTKK